MKQDQINLQNELDLFNKFEEFLASKKIEVTIETIEQELELNETATLLAMRCGLTEDITRLAIQRSELKSCLIDLLKNNLETFKKVV